MDFFPVRQRRSSGKVFSKRNDRRNSDVLREHAPPRFFVLKSLRYAVILFLNQKHAYIQKQIFLQIGYRICIYALCKEDRIEKAPEKQTTLYHSSPMDEICRCICYRIRIRSELLLCIFSITLFFLSGTNHRDTLWLQV